MPVTPESAWRCPPRISLARFERILRERGNPGVLAERPASSYYNICVNKGVDPLFILAKFNHESSLGTAGVAVTTHSWGNTRAPNFGAIPIGTTAGRTGTFPIWRDWLDGLVSTVERLISPEWVYWDRETIREIYDHPSGKVWAPAGDMNDPAGYLRAVIDFMNANEDMPVVAQLPGFQWKPADTRHFTAGRTARIRGGAQHYSAGTNSLNWLTTNPQSNVSATVLVKHYPTLADRGWQLVRIEDTAHTTAFANPYTVSIEYEHDGAQPIPDIAYEVLGATWADIERYVLAQRLGDFSEGIKGHKEWVNNPGLICPDGIDMQRVIERWQHHRTPEINPDYDPVTRKYVHPEFSRYYRENGGLMVFGRPITGGFIEDGRLTQYFERSVFQHFPDHEEPYKVLLRLLGAEELSRRYPNGAPA